MGSQNEFVVPDKHSVVVKQASPMSRAEFTVGAVVTAAAGGLLEKVATAKQVKGGGELRVDCGSQTNLAYLRALVTAAPSGAEAAGDDAVKASTRGEVNGGTVTETKCGEHTDARQEGYQEHGVVGE